MKTFQFLCYKDQLKSLKNLQKESNLICLGYMAQSLNLHYAIRVEVSEKQYLDCAGSTLF